jgi:hypothetical protein
MSLENNNKKAKKVIGYLGRINILKDNRPAKDPKYR